MVQLSHPYMTTGKTIALTIWTFELQRIDAFKLWCCRRLLRVPWTVRRSNQSVLKEINPDYSLEELMLKLQYLGHLIGRVDLLEKTLVLGKIEGRRIRGQQRMRWLDGISSSVTLFCFCLQSFPASGSFPMSWLFTSDGQSIGALASASVLPMNIQC